MKTTLIQLQKSTKPKFEKKGILFHSNKTFTIQLTTKLHHATL